MATTSPTLPPPPTSPGPGEPRHLILPAGIVATGWPAARDTCAKVGIHFDPWQQEMNRGMLAKEGSGFYAADTIVISICRQSGKTFDVGGVTFADSIVNPGTTTVWTAHRFKVARESFNELKSLATRPEMLPHIDPDAITTAAGNETIPFRNGSRIVFAARERGAIRGFTKVRRLILDEAQILTESAMSDLVPTTNQAENPQIVLMGTPPKPSDPGEVFTALRTGALDGTLEGVMYVEFSADPDCDIDDWDAVAQANPSFPKRTGKRAVMRLRKLLTNEDDYRREGLGIWDRMANGSVIDIDHWMSLGDPKSQLTDPVTFAIDVSPDRRSSIGVAGKRRDGKTHVEVIENERGTAWVVARIQQLAEKWPTADVVLDPSGPAGSLVTDLAGVGIEPTLVSGREMAQACGRFYDLVAAGDLRHLGNQPNLNAAVDAARKRNLGDAWAWRRKDGSHDISPLVAVTLALFGHDLQATKKPKRSGRVW